MEQIRATRFNLLPPVVKNLLIINGLFFLATIAIGRAYQIDLNTLLGLHYFESQAFRPYQFVSYMFMHGSFTHLLFNMFALWMFGYMLENIWGGKRFLIYYLITALGAALMHTLVQYIEITQLKSALSPENINEIYEFGRQTLMSNKNYSNPAMGQMNLILNTPTVGASGAVFGILLAFGMLFPNSVIYIYFLLPIKAKWFVIIYGALELFSGLANSGDNIAHFAHLGGMIFGFILIKFWNKTLKNKFY